MKTCAGIVFDTSETIVGWFQRADAEDSYGRRKIHDFHLDERMRDAKNLFVLKYFELNINNNQSNKILEDFGQGRIEYVTTPFSSEKEIICSEVYFWKSP